MSEPKNVIAAYDYSAQGFEHVFLKLDRLHDLAAEGRVSQVTQLSEAEVGGWLQDIIFTAQETLRELNRHAPGSSARVRSSSSLSNRPNPS